MYLYDFITANESRTIFSDKFSVSTYKAIDTHVQNYGPTYTTYSIVCTVLMYQYGYNDSPMYYICIYVYMTKLLYIYFSYNYKLL